MKTPPPHPTALTPAVAIFLASEAAHRGLPGPAEDLAKQVGAPRPPEKQPHVSTSTPRLEKKGPLASTANRRDY